MVRVLNCRIKLIKKCLKINRFMIKGRIDYIPKTLMNIKCSPQVVDSQALSSISEMFAILPHNLTNDT
jgi:hypothetical protein